MRREPASIVVPATGSWDSLRACLEALRPTLGVRDQVIVVIGEAGSARAAQLHRLSWVDVVDVVDAGDASATVGGLRAAGVRAARHDVVVFLDQETIVTGRVLDALVTALDDPAVAAAGPRSNLGQSDQQAGHLGYRPGLVDPRDTCL